MNRQKLLLIAPRFFSYYLDISSTLQTLGWDVNFIEDRPDGIHTLTKIGIRKFRRFLTFFLEQYYLNLLQAHPVYDFILVIKGEGITPGILKNLRKNHLKHGGKICLYLWDSLQNSPGALENFPCFDHVFTFDPEDAAKYGFELLPLFYFKSNSIVSATSSTAQNYDLCFIGSVHGDRLQVLSRIKKLYQKKLKIFCFIFFPSRFHFMFHRLSNPDFYSFSNNELSLSPLAKSKVYEIFKNSKAVIDIQHEKQRGLTMRTMESLSLGKKLVTTNPRIQNYDFFDESQICVIDRNNPVIQEGFLDSQIQADCLKKIEKYEIKDWCQRITEI